jgi:hypothetical protein
MERSITIPSWIVALILALAAFGVLFLVRIPSPGTEGVSFDMQLPSPEGGYSCGEPYLSHAGTLHFSMVVQTGDPVSLALTEPGGNQQFQGTTNSSLSGSVNVPFAGESIEFCLTDPENYLYVGTTANFSGQITYTTEAPLL